MKNILIGAQVFCWQKIINPLGQKFQGALLPEISSCVGINISIFDIQAK
jgi:hypothetical protein